LDKVDRGILELLEQGAVKAEGRLECAIVERLRLPKRPTTYKMVVGKLERLEEKGRAIIERNGSVLRSVKLAPEVKAVLPSYRAEEDELLAEELVSIVYEQNEGETVSESQVSNSNAERVESSATAKEPIWVQLSYALFALQAKASPEGRFSGLSAQTIADALNISIHQANALNGKLAKLGLRKTIGHSSSQLHQVNMTVKEVTEQMVIGLTAPPKNATPKVVLADDTSHSAVESDVETPGTVPVVKKMAHYLKVLVKENDTLKGDVARLTQELAAEKERYDRDAEISAGVVTRLTADLGTADERIKKLQKQISDLSAPPGEDVTELLSELSKRIGDVPS
jgi:hypothetical protein